KASPDAAAVIQLPRPCMAASLVISRASLMPPECRKALSQSSGAAARHAVWTNCDGRLYTSVSEAASRPWESTRSSPVTSRVRHAAEDRETYHPSAHLRHLLSAVEADARVS